LIEWKLLISFVKGQLEKVAAVATLSETKPNIIERVVRLARKVDIIPLWKISNPNTIQSMVRLMIVVAQMLTMAVRKTRIGGQKVPIMVIALVV
jgi:hypothetical protein